MNRSDFDFDLNEGFDPYSDVLTSGDAHESGHGSHSGEVPPFEHPCLELKKMLGGGTFYYSVVRFTVISRIAFCNYFNAPEISSCAQGTDQCIGL